MHVKRLGSIAIVISVIVLSTGPIKAQGYFKTRSDSKAALAGQSITLRRHYSMNSDCSSNPLPRIRVLKYPKLGKLLIQRGTRVVDYSTYGAKVKCNFRRVPSRTIRYRAGRNSHGTDHIVYEIYWESGRIWREEFRIFVR